MSNTLDVVVGSQFGSEGKGHVTAQVVARHHETGQRVINMRVAGPNAGHCVVDAKGTKYPLRSIPVGAAISDDIWCYIAPGSEVDLDVLTYEMDLLHSGGHNVRLYVHEEATLLTEGHRLAETKVDLQGKIGSTGKGIGAARADRIMRSAQRVSDSNTAARTIASVGGMIVTDHWLDNVLSTHNNLSIVIEGTQGYGLGMHAGHYPQCTSSDARAIDFLAMAGVNPWDRRIDDFQVWAVARVYPIRVAGNSGPLQGETTWEDLGLPPEHTTVTHKVRRVGEWDSILVRDAIRANGGPGVVKVALTMVDQKIPALAGMSSNREIFHPNVNRNPGDSIIDDLANLIRSVQDCGTEVTMITTSDRTAIWL